MGLTTPHFRPTSPWAHRWANRWAQVHLLFTQFESWAWKWHCIGLKLAMTVAIHHVLLCEKQDPLYLCSICWFQQHRWGFSVAGLSCRTEIFNWTMHTVCLKEKLHTWTHLPTHKLIPHFWPWALSALSRIMSISRGALLLLLLSHGLIRERERKRKREKERERIARIWKITVISRNNRLSSTHTYSWGLF